MQSSPYCFFRKKTENFNRRANWHDYHSHSIYMITLLKNPHFRNFSEFDTPASIAQTAMNAPLLKFSNAGKSIAAAITDFRKSHGNLKIFDYVIMPDHVHFIIEIIDSKGKHLGEYISELKHMCKRRFKAFNKNSCEVKNDLLPFLDGYNDRILRKKNQLKILKNYIKDNPRRLWIKIHNPDFFNRDIVINLNGRQYHCYGNFLLLKEFSKSFVRVSRDNPDISKEKWPFEWKETVRNEGCLISPFISPGEKRVLDEAAELGSRFIHIVDTPFRNRYKPTGRFFNLCAEGRLLEISIMTKVEEESILNMTKRQRFLYMNEFAKFLSETSEINTRVDGKLTKISFG